MAAIIKKCKCESEFQDRMYGRYNRVYNTSETQDKAKCTVCGNVLTYEKKSGKTQSIQSVMTKTVVKKEVTKKKENKETKRR